MMTFETTDREQFAYMIANAVREGLTFKATSQDGVYTITFTGGY